MPPAASLEQGLRASFKGVLIAPDHPEYDEARKIWNGAIDRRPALIARCTDEDDAALALAHALRERVPVSIRGGGHNVAGSALVDGGVVIDFSMLRRVEVDPARRLATAQAGALWGDFDAATQTYGLAAPAGIVSHTGVAGLTVGGGFGWLSRRWGLTVDNLLGVRMILADGSRVRAAADENEELFWAVRGGGGNFGIVTEFQFQLHELGTEVVAGPLLYRREQAREVLDLYREFIADAPDELAVYLNLRTAPAFDWVPLELRGRDVLMVIPCWCGNLDEGEAVLKPLREFGPPAADLVMRKPYLEHQKMFDPSVPHYWGYYWKSHYLPPLTDGLADVLIEQAWQKTGPTSYVLIFHLAGAISRVEEDSSAASGRDAAYAVNINADWAEGGAWHPDIEWCRRCFAALEPHATGGVYVNFLHNDEGETRVRAAYGKRYDRLARIKASYDPENVFRSNQNIRPTDAASK